MTSKSMPWTTSNTGDGPTAGYATDRWQEMLRTLSTLDPTLYYVAPGRLNEYAATGSVSPVAVNTGEGFVNGRYVLDDASQNIAVATPTVSTRIDRIILRSDGTAQTVRVVRLAGTEGSGVPPTLTQNSTTYEVSLWKVTITTGGAITLVDERGWLGIRGLVDATTIEWDTSGKKIRVKDAGITAAKLASDAVTTVKILDANVTTAKIADNAITSAKLLNDSVTSAKILDGSVGPGELASDAVTTVKILDANVTNAKLASGIDGSKITSGTPSVAGLTATGQVKSTAASNHTGSGFLVESTLPSIAWGETDASANEKYWDALVSTKVWALRVVNDANNASTTAISVTRGTGATLSGITLGAAVSVGGGITVNGNAVVTGTISGTPVDGFITTAAQLSSNVVNTAQLINDSVTSAKILDGSVGTGELASDAVTTVKLAADAVDDTKVGNRVPQFYRRQGASGTDWTSQGSTSQTPTTVRMQSGSVRCTFPASSTVSNLATVTFPQAFKTGTVPAVFAQSMNQAQFFAVVVPVNNSSFSVYATYAPGAFNTAGFTVDIVWLAVGDE